MALLLFNIFLDFVVRHALENMRLDSGISVQFRVDDNLFYFALLGEGLLLH